MKEAEKYLGKQIEHFRLDRFIARGAMGMVFEAYDSTLDRKVAIKLVPKDEEGGPPADDVRKRFIQEARIGGRLTHPNIVTVYSYGEIDELQYICMEYVEGETLARFLKTRRRLDPETVFLIFEQILSAIEAAHEKKIVHRDIKPANIMITPSGKVKIMDFGIARDPSLSLTGRGTILGTPYYMSPEQVSGLPIDTRSDIFSTGAVLYQVLTGRKPFDGETASTLVGMIVHAEPVPPRDLNERIPKELCPVIGKAMAKEPDKRYQSALEMLQALRVAMGKPALAGLASATSDRPVHGMGENTPAPEAGSPPAPLDESPAPGAEGIPGTPPPSPEGRGPDKVRQAVPGKTLPRSLVAWLCVLLLAGASAALLFRPSGPFQGTFFKDPAIRDTVFALRDFFVRLASKTFPGRLLLPETRGSGPRPPISSSTPVPSVRLAGTYRLEGVNPDGTRYSGTATIVPSTDRLLVTWYVANRVYSGAGISSGQVLTIYWTDGIGRTGVMVYYLGADGVLTGSWADGKGTETWIPAR